MVVYQLPVVKAFPKLRRVAVAALPVHEPELPDTLPVNAPVKVVEKVFDQGDAALPSERVFDALGVILLQLMVPTAMFGVPDKLLAVPVVF